ncbi:hypothetical protein OsJ_36242 [Oryza sativa Japonica Group]|uniref:Uncharacterized protein n=1 Tax=Oryza sativa subsp. japonica TaxID=39947 RepID=B9GDC8_ORYSJ|nr:hypothetical protein OsJ_36242 [Oryza sativa Japonica Group]
MPFSEHIRRSELRRREEEEEAYAKQRRGDGKLPRRSALGPPVVGNPGRAAALLWRMEITRGLAGGKRSNPGVGGRRRGFWRPDFGWRNVKASLGLALLQQNLPILPIFVKSA